MPRWAGGICHGGLVHAIAVLDAGLGRGGGRRPGGLVVSVARERCHPAGLIVAGWLPARAIVFARRGRPGGVVLLGRRNRPWRVVGPGRGNLPRRLLIRGRRN